MLTFNSIFDMLFLLRSSKLDAFMMVGWISEGPQMPLRLYKKGGSFFSNQTFCNKITIVQTTDILKAMH